MVDAVGATQRLHRIMLAWDYWEVNEKLEESGGVFDKLRAVPSSFSSMKVRPGTHAAAVHGHPRMAARALCTSSALAVVTSTCGNQGTMRCGTIPWAVVSSTAASCMGNHCRALTVVSRVHVLVDGGHSLHRPDGHPPTD